MRDFRELTVWKKAHLLALKIHEITQAFPQQERFGIGAQMRRVAISLPMTIAEGAGQNERLEFIKAVHNALGLASELEYLILLAKDLGLYGANEYATMQTAIVEIKKMLSGLRKSVGSHVHAEG